MDNEFNIFRILVVINAIGRYSKMKRESRRYFWFSINVSPTTLTIALLASCSMDSGFFYQKK